MGAPVGVLLDSVRCLQLTTSSQSACRQFLRPRLQAPRRLTLSRPVRSSAGTVRIQAPTCKLAQGTQTGSKEAILCERLKGHSGAVTAALVLRDDGNKTEVVTASMDKSMTLWHVKDCPSCLLDGDGTSTSGVTEHVRLQPPGGPIFSLCQDGSALGVNHHQVFAGNYAREIVAWEPPDWALQEKVVLGGHTGWVRSLATCGRWLFSSSCNVLRQWDMARAVPRHVRDVKLFTGDILALATGGGRVYSCGADGSIRSWEIGKKGELTEAGAREKGHVGRVAGAACGGGFLYTVSHDGSLKMWDGATMELVAAVKGAHAGEKVQCLAVGGDGQLYTGGEDKLIRRWNLGLLTPSAEPLYCHNYAVRTLAAGPLSLLVSGDASGEIGIWRL